MEIFFQDPSEVPLPPNEVRIREVRAEPWPDSRRVHFYLEVDPFQKRPNADVLIYNDEGQEVAQASVIESMTRKMEFTIHLREEAPRGKYKGTVILFYLSELPQPEPDQQTIIEMPAATEVDRAEFSFSIET
jgi:hypothetical protein